MDDVAARTQGRVAARGIELAYEAFGQAGDPAIVLVMGWATQMIAWPDEICERLAARGHFVVRFDNRDTGASTHLDRKKPAPSLGFAESVSVGAQSSSWFATHSTWSGVKLPESSRIRSSMSR